MKTFKQVAGLTLIAYLDHARPGSAAQLLRETSQSIAEIACATGFADQSYFDKRFKGAFGCTPKEFRAGSCEGPKRRPIRKIVQKRVRPCPSHPLRLTKSSAP